MTSEDLQTSAFAYKGSMMMTMIIIIIITIIIIIIDIF